MKKQTGIAKKQYQVLGKVYEFDKKDDFKTLTGKDKTVSDKDLKCINFSFNKYQNGKDFKTQSYSSKIWLFENIS